MDERLKQKLELLGEPTLPESLSAEALFRRMDSGELVLPEGPEAGAASSGKVIPWAKVLRRGLPIAACLALVVLLAQGGLWRMGSSGGNLAGGAAQITSSAPARDGGTDQAETYSFDAANDGPAQDPDPGPRAIVIDEEADADTARAENDELESTETVDGDEDTAASEDADENLRPDTGGDDLRPDSGWDDFNNANPDSGPVVNPDIGPADYDREQNNLKAIKELASVEEMCGQLYLYDESLVGLTPVLQKYGPVSAEPPECFRPFHIWCRFENAAGEVVARRVIYCSVSQKADGGYNLELLAFEEWDGEEDRLISWDDLG